MSSGKRPDNKNRILNRGESQRKDGRYTYKYTDALGNVRYVYSWKLLPADKTPAGKREDLSLREKERLIQRDLFDGIDTRGSRMTLCQLYAKKNAQRPNVKKNTQEGRRYLMEALKADKLGTRSIDRIKPSDAKEWALRMKEKGYSYKTINNYKRSLKACFCLAIEDDYVRKNPFDFPLSEVLTDDSRPKSRTERSTGSKIVRLHGAGQDLSKVSRRCVYPAEDGTAGVGTVRTDKERYRFQKPHDPYQSPAAQGQGRFLYQRAKDQKRCPQCADEQGNGESLSEGAETEAEADIQRDRRLPQLCVPQS